MMFHGLNLSEKSSGWFKRILPSGEWILGEDRLVDSKQVSWRATGTLADAVCCWEKATEESITIYGAGEFWQSDDFQAPFSKNKTVTGTRITRRIQRKITSEDKCFSVLQLGSRDMILEVTSSIENSFTSINPEWIDKWFTLELHLDKSKKERFGWYLSPTRI